MQLLQFFFSSNNDKWRFEGGIKWDGILSGKSWPFSLISIKYIAKANSSLSSIPSLVISDKFQILVKTGLGNFVLKKYCLASSTLTFPLTDISSYTLSYLSLFSLTIHCPVFPLFIPKK